MSGGYGHRSAAGSGSSGAASTIFLSISLPGWRLWRLAREGDIIVAKTDPPLLSVVIAPIAWLKGAHLVNWLQDIFPEVAEALNVGGGLGRVAFRMLRPFRNWSLRFATINVVVGEGMATRLEAQGIPQEKHSIHCKLV